MKRSLHVLAGIAAVCLILSFAACKEKEESATYSLETEENGILIRDTMTLDARGDKVYQMTETIVVDMAGIDAEAREMICALYEELVVSYGEVDGVECTGEKGEESYTIRIVIDTTGDAVAQLAEQGLLEVEGSAEGISLEGTAASLENQGYELVE